MKTYFRHTQVVSPVGPIIVIVVCYCTYEDKIFLSLSDYQSDEDSARSGQRSARSTSSARGDADANLEWQLEQEIKRRIAAEDAMVLLQQQRNEMACHLAYIDGGGLGLIDSERDVWDAAYQAQKLVVAREVASSIARGATRAAAEVELETVIADKNREVARLRDKLQYFELVNHEMSQRNQEAIGTPPFPPCPLMFSQL